MSVTMYVLRRPRASRRNGCIVDGRKPASGHESQLRQGVASGHPQGRSAAKEPQSGLTRRNPLTFDPTCCGFSHSLFAIYARFCAAVNSLAAKRLHPAVHSGKMHAEPACGVFEIGGPLAVRQGGVDAREGRDDVGTAEAPERMRARGTEPRNVARPARPRARRHRHRERGATLARAMPSGLHKARSTKAN